MNFNMSIEDNFASLVTKRVVLLLLLIPLTTTNLK